MKKTALSRILFSCAQTWPVFFLLLLCIVLFVSNYIPGTYLTGWDNLHPEYDFGLNMKRSLFSVWQEYQGLGLLGGHAHSSDLPRQLMLYLLSSFLPQSLLRYLSTFAMLYIGSVGAYAVARKLLFPTKPRSVSLLVGVFYLLNLATIQTFYVPFESFTAHFASLPWLLLASLLYLKNKQTKYVFLLILVLLLSLPAVYIPTLFVVFMMVLSITILPYFFTRNFKPILTRAVKLYSIIFLVNAFWLLPFLYFTATNATVNLQSKINQSATETIFLQNKEFGTIGNMMLLKGFWFKNIDPNFDGVFTYMLSPWTSHIQNPFMTALGILFFAVIFIGFVQSLRSKEPLFRALALLFVFCFIALAVSTPPFSFINQLVRDHLPLFNQAFRFPFTKFSLLAGLVYSLLFAIGFQSLTETFKRYVPKRNLLQHKAPIVLCLGLLFLYSFPAFQGHLFYEKEKISVPPDYINLFKYFKEQDPNTRIANLPQYTFWGWNFYRWGYGGSGFLWYGIQQPILDRAFDVWSKTDENYYYEISNAINAKKPQLLADVINKYQINWLLIDKNIIYPPSPKALLLDEIEPLITAIPGMTKTATFGNIIVYKTALRHPFSSFVSTSSELPSVNSYSWNQFDMAYSILGMYENQTTAPDYSYPFRSLFSNKTEKEREFGSTDTGPTLTFSQKLPKNTLSGTLNIPSLTAVESVIPMTIETIRTEATLGIFATFQSPQIVIDQQSTGGEIFRQLLFTLPIQSKTKDLSYTLNINGAISLPVPQSTMRLKTTFFSLDQSNVFVLSENKTKTATRVSIAPAQITKLPLFQPRSQQINSSQDHTLSVIVPKIDDDYLSASLNPQQFKSIENCDTFRQGAVRSEVKTVAKATILSLKSQNATACIPFFLKSLPHKIAYAIFITSENKQGRSLHFWMENSDAKSGTLDTYLPGIKKETDTPFILPPLDEYGNSYALHFDNISIGHETSENTLKRVSIYPVPYTFLSSLVFSQKILSPLSIHSSQINVLHPNESLYIVSGQRKADKNLILSQSYNTGWHAYEVTSDSWLTRIFPMVLGKELPHFMVNNWENGFSLDTVSSDKTIIILYLPQYLQYSGALLLVGLILACSMGKIRSRSQT